jgi:hypothetical protein
MEEYFSMYIWNSLFVFFIAVQIFKMKILS